MLLNALLSGDLTTALILLALSLPALVLCFTVHEASHAGAAYLLGDKTAMLQGRITLSPLAHIDPVGFLFLLLFGFGWARPVPVNALNFKNPRAGMAITAAAGPLSNLVGGFLLYLLLFLLPSTLFGNAALGTTVSLFVQIAAQYSVGLGVFNLIPIFPLDGSRIVDAFLSPRLSEMYRKSQQIGIVLFALALFFNWFDYLIAAADVGIQLAAISLLQAIL